MEDQYFGLVNTVVGGLIGLIVGFFTSWYQNRFEVKRDQISFERSKLEKIKSEEINNCIELKENIRLWMRSWIKIADFDNQSLKEHGKLTRIPDNLNQDFFELGISINTLAARVLDDEVRETVKNLKSRNAEVMAKVIVTDDINKKLSINASAFIELTHLATDVGELIDAYQRKLIQQ